MPIQKLKEFLDGNKVKYVTIRHSTAYTAQETAASAHIPGKELAKTVVLRIDGKMAIAVLPASHKLDIPLLKKAVGASDVEIAHEADFRDMFPGCDTGAMPPFGNLYGMDVLVDSLLAENAEIAFNACSHSELVKLKYADYIKLVKPKVVSFSALR
jgi:Ala-tRNA(Pro) deacylase